MSFRLKYGTAVFLLLLACRSRAQIYYSMGEYKNVVTLSSGLNDNFANSDFGYARREYFKLIRREIVGLINVSLPVSEAFFTRHIIKKGIQLDLYSHGRYRIPFTFASSSIIRDDKLVRYHDVTAELTFNPGIYNGKYTLALDLRYEKILFRHYHYSEKYRHDHAADKVKNHWNEPLTNEIKTGIIGACNLGKATVVYVKAGYEDNPFIKQYPFISSHKFRWYAIAGFGYKFGKPAGAGKRKTEN